MNARRWRQTYSPRTTVDIGAEALVPWGDRVLACEGKTVHVVEPDGTVSRTFPGRRAWPMDGRLLVWHSRPTRFEWLP